MQASQTQHNSICIAQSRSLPTIHSLNLIGQFKLFHDATTLKHNNKLKSFKMVQMGTAQQVLPASSPVYTPFFGSEATVKVCVELVSQATHWPTQHQNTVAMQTTSAPLPTTPAQCNNVSAPLPTTPAQCDNVSAPLPTTPAQCDNVSAPQLAHQHHVCYSNTSSKSRIPKEFAF